MIKYGVCQWCIDRRGVDAIARIAELGLTCTQLTVGNDEDLLALSDKTIQAAYLSAAAQHGVAITGLALNMLASSDGMLSPAGSEAHNKALAVIEQSLGIAHAMSVPMMHIPNFGRAEIKTDADMALTADVFRWACVLAEGSGVTIATENPFGVDGHKELFRLVGHPGFKFLLDTRNPVVRGHSAVALIEQLGERMCNQVHVKDGQGGVKGSVSLGTGDGDFAASARALLAAGFDGYIISENRYEQDAERLLAEDMAVLRGYFG